MPAHRSQIFGAKQDQSFAVSKADIDPGQFQKIGIGLRLVDFQRSDLFVDPFLGGEGVFSSEHSDKAAVDHGGPAGGGALEMGFAQAFDAIDWNCGIGRFGKRYLANDKDAKHGYQHTNYNHNAR